MNPSYKVAPVGGRQLPKESPGFRTRLQRLSDVRRQVRDGWPCPISVVRGRRRQPGGGEQSGRLEFRPALAIGIGPFAGGLPRRELASVPVVIEAFDEAVDPAEAQSLSN